ncbi:hypothetical protein [Zobellia laminariae]|uniref:hypothetical protein n=1 Tax=Zobellia laminariae TaxID=248906 RepID=UPI0026F40E8E|nr:hypothetical protein [Zobellia laminariae]WKX76769.1 hypothetical protein Q5W13_00910 [Zobellia laminariae]
MDILGGNGGPKVNEKGKEVGFDYYFKEKCLPQVKEIVTQYGDIAMVWFDTPGIWRKNMWKNWLRLFVNINLMP